MPATTADELLARAVGLPALAPLEPALIDDSVPPVYLVGGAVRDLLRGRAPLDLDLAVDGPVAPLAERLGGEMRAHERFETATVAGHDGGRIDIARSRRETYSSPGALPDVAPAPIEADLERRDFTVNALALALNGVDRGRLYTVANGLEDLRAGQLRVLHSASFVDDPTRLLRLARYRARLRFQVELHTLALVNAAVADHALDTLTGARIGHELRLLAAEPDPVAALTVLGEIGVDRAIDPRFTIGQRLPGDALIARKAFALLPSDGRRDRLTLAAALRWVRPNDLIGLLRRMAFNAEDRDAIYAAATRGQRLADALSRVTLPSEIAAVVGAAGVEQVALAGALGAESQAREWLDELRHVELAIDGEDLRAAGIAEGPALGAGLAAARSALLDGVAADREAQLKFALLAATEYVDEEGAGAGS